MLICEKEGKRIKELLTMFKETLHVDYRTGFIKAINTCSKGLNIDNKIAIVLNSICRELQLVVKLVWDFCHRHICFF